MNKKPPYLLAAIENAEEMWATHDELVNNYADHDLIVFALKNALICDDTADVCYDLWNNNYQIKH